MLSFKPTFSLSSFTFIKRLLSSSSLSAIRVVSSAYLRLLIFLCAKYKAMYLSHSISSNSQTSEELLLFTYYKCRNFSVMVSNSQHQIASKSQSLGTNPGSPFSGSSALYIVPLPIGRPSWISPIKWHPQSTADAHTFDAP